MDRAWRSNIYGTKSNSLTALTTVSTAGTTSWNYTPLLWCLWQVLWDYFNGSHPKEKTPLFLQNFRQINKSVKHPNSWNFIIWPLVSYKLAIYSKHQPHYHLYASILFYQDKLNSRQSFELLLFHSEGTTIDQAISKLYSNSVDLTMHKICWYLHSPCWIT